MKFCFLIILTFLYVSKAEATVGYSLFNALQITAKWNLTRGIHSKIPIGVVGAGRIGRMHIANIIRYIPEAKIRYVADPYLPEHIQNDPAILSKTSNYTELLKDKEISGVAIFTSTDQHVKLIRESLEAGKKYILCEKPVSADPQEIYELEKQVDAHSAQVMVAFNRRFDHEIIDIKEKVNMGKIGTPCLLKITNHDGIYPPMETLKNLGSIFADLHSHDFDSARNILNSEVKSVTAFGAATHPEMKKLSGSYDTCVVVLRMENDCITMISGMRQDGGGYQNAIEAIGTTNRIGFGPRRIVDSESGEGRNPRDFGEYFEQSMIDELREFVSCISLEKIVPVSLKEARHVAEVSAAANKSAEIFLQTGKTREVFIEEIQEENY